MLTDRFVKNAKPGMYADEGGLYLRVMASGKKSWVRRHRVDGKDRWRVIGSYPGTTLASARGLLYTADKPIVEAIDEYMSKLKVKRPEQARALLAPLCAVSMRAPRKELVALLQHKAEKAPVHANRMLTRWKDFFSFCEQNGWIQENPLAIVLRKYVGGKELPRDRNLSWDELSGFLRLSLNPDTKFALYFILASGLRSSEALWVLRNAKLADIPTKTTPHRVPPVPHVRALLRRIGSVPASHNTLSNALRRKGVGYTPHDLRRTFATRLSDLGVMPHVVEKLLNHRMVGVMAIYNHAEYWQERVEAMKLWGRHLAMLRRAARSARASPDSAPT